MNIARWHRFSAPTGRAGQVGLTTYYEGDEQIVLNTTAGTVSGTRYYTLGGVTVAARASAGALSYLIPDRQGTDQFAVNASTQAATRRQTCPSVRRAAPRGRRRRTPEVLRAVGTVDGLAVDRADLPFGMAYRWRTSRYLPGAQYGRHRGRTAGGPGDSRGAKPGSVVDRGRESRPRTRRRRPRHRNEPPLASRMSALGKVIAETIKMY
jgi:hypothetical protein